MIALITVLMVWGACSTSILSQTMTNNGTIIYVAPKAVVQVNGSAEVRAAGIVTAEDSSSIRVTGSLQVTNGSVNLNKRSTVLVSGNVETGGVCSQPSGVVIRNSPGTLTVTGSVLNKGLLNNNSTIFVGTTLKNDGELNNSPGSLIEVGP
jgi:hypothetical protein